MTHIEELLSHKRALLREIEFLTTKLEDHDTGHIRTTIGVLEKRVKEITEFNDDVHRKTWHLMNGIVNWDKIMSTPGNL
jgi:hypothetical protein